MTRYAILWDLDGTISDSFDSFYQALTVILEKYNAPQRITSEAYKQRYFGKSFPGILDLIYDNALPETRKQQISAEYHELFNKIIRETGNIRFVPGVKRVLDHFYAAGVPMAIASSSELSTILTELQALEIQHYFGNIISGNYLPPKPAPDIFLLAARSLNMAPEACVVIEDSLAGMQGAEAAGMKCVGIATSKRVEEMSAADIALQSFASLDFSEFERLLGFPK